jgi:hypothetical protein
MLLVRNCFIAKPGQASKLATMFKELATAVPIPNHRVLSDMTGDFNRVVFEYEVESFAAVDKMLQEYASNPVFREKMQGYTELWQSGHREIMKIW